MKKQIDGICAKDISQGGLTQGQQTQIARNEQRTEQILKELENLEETLNESIRESFGAHVGKLSHGKKKGAIEEEERLRQMTCFQASKNRECVNCTQKAQIVILRRN